jgi:hypothetical protein
MYFVDVFDTWSEIVYPPTHFLVLRSAVSCAAFAVEYSAPRTLWSTRPPTEYNLRERTPRKEGCSRVRAIKDGGPQVARRGLKAVRGYP